MDNALISVIVPAYNVEHYVKRTIESLQKQTHSNLEIVCVDDGSRDGTFQVISAIAAEDSRVKALHKENEGVTKARQYGVEHSHGQYFGFVDADDIVEPTMYEKLYANLIRYQTDISHCGYVMDNLDGSHVFFYGTGKLICQDPLSGINDLISGRYEPTLCNKLFKNSLLQSLFQNRLMDDSIHEMEDMLMNYYLFKNAGSSVFEDVCLYHYVKREGSVTQSGFNRSNNLDKVKVREIILKDSVGTEYEDAAMTALLKQCIHTYNVFSAQKDTDCSADLQMIRTLLAKNKSGIQLLDQKYRFLVRTLLASPAAYKLLLKAFR